MLFRVFWPVCTFWFASSWIFSWKHFAKQCVITLILRLVSSEVQVTTVEKCLCNIFGFSITFIYFSFIDIGRPKCSYMSDSKVTGASLISKSSPCSSPSSTSSVIFTASEAASGAQRMMGIQETIVSTVPSSPRSAPLEIKQNYHFSLGDLSFHTPTDPQEHWGSFHVESWHWCYFYSFNLSVKHKTLGNNYNTQAELVSDFDTV